MHWCWKPDTRQRNGGHDAGLVDQDCTDESSNGGGVEDDDGDDYEGDDNCGLGDGEWMKAMLAALQIEEKSWQTNLWAQFHEWLEAPYSLWNTNDAKKSFWTIREEKGPAVLVQEKAEVVYHSWKNHYVRIEFTLWVTIRSKDVFFSVGSFIHKIDKFVVCPCTPPEWGEEKVFFLLLNKLKG